MIEVSSQEHTSAIEIGYRNLLTPGVLPPSRSSDTRERLRMKQRQQVESEKRTSRHFFDGHC